MTRCNENIDSFSLFVFDLDDTLYRETEFLFSAYGEMANYVASRNGGNAEQYKSYLCKSFVEDGRGRLFDKFIANFHLDEVVNVGSLLHIMREHKCELHLFPQAKLLLNYLLEAGKQVFILTNGNVEQQQNKVEGLSLPRLYPQIGVIYSNAIEPKPSPKGLEQILSQTGISKHRSVFIGDSSTDEQTAKNAGMCFLDIKNIIDYEH